ncbi:protein spalten-like [Schistocerca gregaria]|uniref:protein spalten-like n=1 Tax=Schistocerca gregaria TaxID=7010 RepID=UPI00211F09F1|nr:protein spalten-like [Schistocerca gregaria]
MRPRLMEMSESAFCCVSRGLVGSGWAAVRGFRPRMEDYVCVLDDLNEIGTRGHVNRSFYAVYDGHAGSLAAEMASEMVARAVVEELGFGEVETVFRRVLLKCDKMIIERCDQRNSCSGTTALICMIEGERLYVVNLGDSEVVLAYVPNRYWDGDKSSRLVARVLSEKHTPTQRRETKRFSQFGGIILNGRIFGKLAVSRALGDSEYKIPKINVNYVSNEPFIRSLQLDPSHRFLILASDGLWSKVSPQQAVDFVQERLLAEMPLSEISREIAQHAIERGSQDNVSVIVVSLNWRHFE